MNILIVGLGSIAWKHLDAIKRTGLSVNIFAYRSKQEAEIFSGITNIFNLEECDLIFSFAIVSNPTFMHYEFIKILYRKGVSLFIEKPPVCTVRQLDDVLSIAKNSSVTSYVACNLRFHPCIEYVKRQLEFKGKRINEVNVYCGSYLPDWRENRNFRETYSVKVESGGGVHLDLFHELDYTIWLFGFPQSSRLILRNVSGLEIDSMDYANYLLEYDSFSACITLNYYRRDSKRFFEIVFEDETWTVDLLNSTVVSCKGKLLFEKTGFAIRETYFNQMQYFIEKLNSKESPMNSLEESGKILRICLNDE